MLEWTGERFLPEVGSHISFEHYLRYAAAKDVVAGKIVLDCPGGEGFGSAMLSETAKQVYSVDISAEAVAHSSQKYQASNLKYQQSNMSQLSAFDSHFFDVVVCFEGIEHVDSDTQLLALKEFKRVLRPDGVLLISTPNKKVYSDIPNYNNEYHVKEFYEQEFEQFLGTEFSHLKFYGQSIINSCVILDLEKGRSAQMRVSGYEEEKRPDSDIRELTDNWVYYIAVCSNHEVNVPWDGAILLDFNRRLESENNGRFGAEIQRIQGELDLERFKNSELIKTVDYLENLLVVKVRKKIGKIYRSLFK